MNVTVIGVKLHAERFEAEDVHVNLARTEIAAARHSDLRAVEAPEKRAHDRRRGAHLGDELVRGLPAIDRRCVDDEGVLVRDLDGGAQPLEHLTHHMNIRDVGHVGERRGARRQKRCSHKLER